MLPACTGTRTASTGSPRSEVTQPARSMAVLPDPCKLITQAEASAAWGIKLGPAQPVDLKSLGKRCRFETGSFDELFLDATNITGLVDSYAHLPDAVSVSGLGDKAVWMPGNTSTLCIVKGNTPGEHPLSSHRQVIDRRCSEGR